MLEIFKSLQNQGIDLQPFSDPQNNKERVLFQAGNRKFSRKFSE